MSGTIRNVVCTLSQTGLSNHMSIVSTDIIFLFDQGRLSDDRMQS